MTKKHKKDVLTNCNITYTTGDPAINAAQFNKDFCESEGGAELTCAENLTEETMMANRVGVEVELPAGIHILDSNIIKAAIKKVEPEEEFVVGYITPVYFYKKLWDKLTIFKCTEMRGWTGEDYIEARPDKTNSEDRIALAKQQTNKADFLMTMLNKDDHTIDGGVHNDKNHLAYQRSDFSARYTLLNKIVKQAKGETLLFYPVVGIRPSVKYFIDLKDGNGIYAIDRDLLVNTVYKKVESLTKQGIIEHKLAANCMDKVREMINIDSQTISAMTWSNDIQPETRSRFQNELHTKKPQVRALYLNQLYYLGTKDRTFGKLHVNSNSLSETIESSLTEKRETKRYYIRPQNIFCANKADVLKTLIEVANANTNCTVYSLKNLSDHDNVHQLTNNDIIYYFDDKVLYDKNHVIVMDYDLYIKHEEGRKKINKDPEALTKQDFDRYYSDRMTKETNIINESYKNFADTATIPLAAFELAIARGEKVDIGANQSGVFDNNLKSGIYAATNYVAYKNGSKYYISEIISDSEGNKTEGKLHKYDSFKDLANGILAIDWATGQCQIDLTPVKENNPLNTTFDSYDEFGNKLTEDIETPAEDCCICGEPIEGYGNNAAPYKEGRCCDACNIKFVIPARLQKVLTKN